VCGQRIGDLILDHLRCLPGIPGEDDHLDIGKIGNGIDRGIFQRIEAADDQKGRGQHHHELIADRPVDNVCKH